MCDIALSFKYSYHALFVTRFFFNDTATTEIYTLSLHDALPISLIACHGSALDREHQVPCYVYDGAGKLHDVSGLTNINTPYSTTASDGKKLEFNVCRKVTGGQGRLLRPKKKSAIEYPYV